MVDRAFRGREIGRRLVETLLENKAEVASILRADSENLDFYRKLGFEAVDLALVHKRKR